MDDLTPRRRAILEFLITFHEQNGYGPSYREVATALGLKSTNAVAYHFDALEEEGYIERGGERTPARSVRLTDKARGTVRDDTVQSIPVVGRVAAGLPVMSEELYEGSLQFDTRLLTGSGPWFALEVQGDSMIEAGILEGDHVIVRRQDTARHNEIVVAVVDGEATVKRLHRDGERVVLIPENRDMSPIIVPPTSDIRLAGVVIGVYRQLG